MKYRSIIFIASLISIILIIFVLFNGCSDNEKKFERSNEIVSIDDIEDFVPTCAKINTDKGAQVLNFQNLVQSPSSASLQETAFKIQENCSFQYSNNKNQNSVGNVSIAFVKTKKQSDLKDTKKQLLQSADVDTADTTTETISGLGDFAYYRVKKLKKSLVTVSLVILKNSTLTSIVINPGNKKELVPTKSQSINFAKVVVSGL